MKRLLIGAGLAAACLAGSGCIAAVAVAAVGAVVISNSAGDKNTGKGPRSTAEAPRPAAEASVRPVPVAAPAAPSAPAAPKELTAESAAGLAQPGRVVVVDAESGARTALDWQDGMTLVAAVPVGKSGSYRTARIVRGTRVLPADLRQDWTGGLALLAGDVVELRR